MDPTSPRTETQVGLTRRGFLSRLVAAGAVAVAGGALAALDKKNEVFELVDREVAKLGEWRKYGKPVIVKSRQLGESTLDFVQRMTDAAVQSMHEQFRNQLLYGASGIQVTERPWDGELVIEGVLPKALLP